MNKIYKSIWNAATGSWVAVAETGRTSGKKPRNQISAAGLSVALLFAAPSFAAQLCVNAPDGSYLPTRSSNPQCDTIDPSTNTQIQNGVIQLAPTASFFILSRNDIPLTVTQDFNVNATVNRGFSGVGNQYTSGLQINLQNGTIKYVSNANSIGIGADNMTTINAGNISIDGTMNANPNASEIYGLLAGSSVISGENIAPNNGKFATINVNNLTLKQSSPLKLAPALNSGLRAIQGASQNAGNGSSGKIVINGTLDMTLTGPRIEGIYVSGAAQDSSGNEAVSQVILKGDSKIVLDNRGSVVAGFDSSAIKLGKSRSIGTGKGYMESHGNMQIDASKAVGDAIKLAVTDSTLNANYATSSANVLAHSSAIAIGKDDYGSSTDSQNISAALGGATLRTISATAPLLVVDGGQEKASLLFDQKSDLAAPANGYLLDIVNARNVSTPSSVQLTLDNGSTMAGLTNKTYANSSINVDLNNQSSWNMVALQSGNAPETSTLNALNINSGSSLNAFNSTGTANFILNASDVTSSAGTINLANGQAGDILTLNANYKGLPSSKLLVDGTWDNPNSLLTDQLKINGNASGATSVSVPGGLLGNITPDAQKKLSNIAVIEVNQAHTDTVFTGTAPTLNGAEAQLVKAGNNYYWTLEATPPPPPPAPTPSPTPSPTPVPTPPVPTPPAPSSIVPHPVPGYVQTQQANVEMGFSQLGKLHERVGEQQTWAWDDCGQRCDQYQSAKDANKKIYPVWGRLNADYLKLQGDNRYGMKSSTGFAQFGGDVNVSKNAKDESRRHTGVMFSYGWGSNTFYDQNRSVNGFISPDKFTGKSSTDMLSLGGYSTWYADNGSYLDLVGQVSFLHNKYSSRTGVSASQNGWGLGASVEVGRPWQLGDSRWQIEPQAQLSYQMVRLNDIDDGTYRVTGMNNDALRGRIGARLAWNDRYKDQKRTKTFYVTANLLRDLTGSSPSANVTSNQASAGNPSTSYGESYGKTWGELGVGAQWAFNKSTYLFADVRYQRSLSGSSGALDNVLGNAQREGYNGRIGVRHGW